MKKALVLSIGVLLCASTAYGQAGHIGLFADSLSFSNCELVDDQMAVVPIYIVHKGLLGATACQFMVAPGGGFDCTYLASTNRFQTTIGDPLMGVAVSYGSCLMPDILLITMIWFCEGLSPVCSWLEVVPHPASPTGTIDIVLCAGLLPATGGIMAVNNDGSCDCGGWHPVDETTWGRVKSLYR